MSSRVTQRVRAVRVTGLAEPGASGNVTRRGEHLVVEEPLELRVGATTVSTTMRTPGDDFDLVHGLLLSEGVITAPGDVRALSYCSGTGPDGRQTYNVISATLAPGITPPAPRVSTTTSACGVCGTDSIEAVRRRSRWSVATDPLHVAPAALPGLADALGEQQRVFARTGGLHGAALARAGADGTDGADWSLRLVREDIGRHNAVDKVLGAALRAGELPARGQVLLTSSRASFELVQKALLAGVSMLAAVSAPSSLAVDLARAEGMTLVAFLRRDRLSVYSGPERLGL